MNQDQAQITVLKFPESVRLRKEMYLIDPNHCLYEIIDNSVDEFSAGRCKNIYIEITGDPSKPDNFPYVMVKDDGGGIPTTPCKDPDHYNVPQAIVAFSTLSAGGKFNAATGYKTNTSGLHGVGASCVNAVSNVFGVQILHDEKLSNIVFKKGVLESESINKPVSTLHIDEELKSGTTIMFQLDETLWTNEKFNFDIVKRRLKQLSYLNPGLKISYKINYNNFSETHEYFHEKGIEEYFQELILAKAMLDNNPILISKTVTDDNVGDININVALGYSGGYISEIYSFVNNVNTQGGDHVTGFNAGLAKAVTNYFASNDKYKSLNKALSNDDTKEGIIAVISVKVMSPKFEGQSKASIKMPEVRSAVNSVVYDEVKLYLDQHPNFSKILADKLEKAAKARIAAKKAREAIRNAKSTLDSSLPGKLSACSSKKPEESEIYLVEGKLQNCPR